MIWYVHGANSTPASFNFIKRMLPEHEAHDFAYDCNTPLADTVKRLVGEINDVREPIHIIAHSLGGLISMSGAMQAERGKIDKIVTLSSPFGGSKVASLMRWIMPSRLMDDIHTSSPVVANLRRAAEADLHSPTLSLVTTEGGLFETFMEPNDGVVTVSSQKALKGPTYIEIDRNHFEVLLCDRVVEEIQGFLF